MTDDERIMLYVACMRLEEDKRNLKKAIEVSTARSYMEYIVKADDFAQQKIKEILGETE